MKLSLEQIAAATGGSVVARHASQFETFHVDSRKMTNGSLFFAIPGSQQDGHLFVQDAIFRGASGVVVERPVEVAANVTIIQVASSMKALQDLAAWVRSQSITKFVGITGSSGKTSTKEFTAQLLSKKYGVFKSEGNLNSVTGLPLSLLSFEQRECAVFEVAMSQTGEIVALSQLLRPDIGVILNVNPVHLGQFSSVDQIADEKCSLLTGMRADAPVIYNADDKRLKKRIHSERAFSFGTSDNATLRIEAAHMQGVRGTSATFRWNNCAIAVRTRLCGEGNLYNIAAATCTALLLEVPVAAIEDAIQELQPYAQRGVLFHADGFDVYDDSYNSNPRALQLALEIVSQSNGYKRKVAVLGDMLELGPEEEHFHRVAGEQLAQNGFDSLIVTGPLSRFTAAAAQEKGLGSVEIADTSAQAAEIARGIVREGDLVLVKGSRGMKMEAVVQALISH